MENKRILLINDNFLMEEAVRQAVGPDVNIVTVKAEESAKKALEQDGDFDAIVLCDLLQEGSNWRNILRKMMPSEKRITVLLRAGLDETTKPYKTKEPFASVHGRCLPDSEASLKSKLSRLLR